MQKGQKQKIFKQFYLSSQQNLQLTSTSKYQKVQAWTKGCFLRRKKHLYKNLKSFTQDLQTVMSYDPESSNIVFKELYPEIRYSYKNESKGDSTVMVQCRRCGQYTVPFKYCPRCEDVHYCSETCEVNVKITHEKEECKIISYPKIYNAVMIQVHFGSNLGQNIQIYFQHQGRAYALVRGKQIIKSIFQFFKGIKSTTVLNTESPQKSLRSSHIIRSRQNIVEQKLLGYQLQLKNEQKYLQFNLKNQKDYRTGTLKVDLEDMDALKRMYQRNQVLEEIQLYLLGEGAIMTHCTEQIHNNHAHWVYLFRMP